ncbi:hypothetical protein SK128_001341 [Halocaridina rubra]|uniref:asparaginase n=1 Tax=Halocaridina rubra TaxID=373956 RepID=A0AAN8X213_HALRR
MTSKPRVLVIYTGGTIGMINNERGRMAPAPGKLEKFIRSDPHLHNDEYMQSTFGSIPNSSLIISHAQRNRHIIYKVKEYEQLLDSSNLTTKDWIHMANDIKNNYEEYDGFVVLHGTDTLDYTASALSFMLENLKKPVVVTGAQIPIFEPRSDGAENMIQAIIIAGCYDIPEVTVLFGRKLIRGNRTVKISSERLEAFTSPNCPPLADFNIFIDGNYQPPNYAITREEFQVFDKLNSNVCLLKFYPAITSEVISAVLRHPMEGAVIEAYGAGNIPSNQDITNASPEECYESRCHFGVCYAMSSRNSHSSL